jgi:hypothetical protein
MGRFAEEIGLVGGDGVDEIGHRLAIGIARKMWSQ